MMMDALYANRNKLEVIFNWFDLDGNGYISREEFNHGCAVLNETLDNDHQLTDFDRILGFCLFFILIQILFFISTSIFIQNFNFFLIFIKIK